MTALPSTRELRALDVVEVVPAGCFALITGEAWSPHLRPGELAIIDMADTALQIGELYALMIQTRDGDRPFVVQPFRRRAIRPRFGEGGIVVIIGLLEAAAERGVSISL